MSSDVWRAYFRESDGHLETVATDNFPDPTPEGLDFNEYPNPPVDLSVQMWDEVIRQFVLRPSTQQVDRIDDLQSDSTFAGFQSVFNELTSQQQTALVNDLIVFLGPFRFRDVNTSVILEE